jgi:acyl carrier protein
MQSKLRKEQLAQTLIDMLLETMDVNLPLEQITPTTPFFVGGMELDSFAVVELITEVEDRYRIEFREEDFLEEHFLTPLTLAALLEKYLVEG